MAHYHFEKLSFFIVEVTFNLKMCLIGHVDFKQKCYEVSGKREIFICDWCTSEYLR